MTAPAQSERIDLAHALRDAGLNALLAFGLLLPLVGFQTYADIRNELRLETRFPLLFAFVAVIAGVRLLYLLVIAPWLARRATRPTLSVEERAKSWSRVVLRWATAIVGAAAIAAGAAALVGTPIFLWQTGFGPPFRTLIVILAGLTLAGFGAGAGLLLIRGGSVGYTRVRQFVPPALAGFLIVYPIVAILGVGFNGSVKWIDNFGIQILIYVMLGWGLNIVVGLAGLLDLGYVAFYAVGAYSYALLASNFGLSFWILLPLAGILSAFWGILLGFPVLRLRGDYLAIVTLAFGEIIRIVIVNWVDLTNGYAGIAAIPRPSFFGTPFTAEDNGFAARFGLEFSPIYRTVFLYYVILALALLTAYVTVRLRRLPVGRAWEALREDEIACRSLGINTTNTKLTAFAMGAMFGGFAGSFFAARQGFISPESFTFIESATILSIVVLGGMGSQIGVAIAAIVMIGGTEILRELEFLKRIFGETFEPTQYRMLLFGFGMVVIMIWRPRGLVSTREPSVFLKERRAISSDLVKEGHG